jgi:hypothetical protein
MDDSQAAMAESQGATDCGQGATDCGQGAMDCGQGATDCGQAATDRGRRESQGMVSLRAEVPAPLLASMRMFIDSHPNWDQYRLMQAALAGFLVQNGAPSRALTRCYLSNMFPNQPGFRPG